MVCFSTHFLSECLKPFKFWYLSDLLRVARCRIYLAFTSGWFVPLVRMVSCGCSVFVVFMAIALSGVFAASTLPMHLQLQMKLKKLSGINCLDLGLI